MDVMDTIVAVGNPDNTAVLDCFDKYPQECPHLGTDALLLYQLLSSAGFLVKWLKVNSFLEAGQLLQNGSANISAWMDPYNEGCLLPEVVHNLTPIFSLPGDEAFFVYKKLDLSVFQHVILSGGFKLPVWALIAAAGGLCYTLVVSFKALYRPRIRRFRDLESLFLCWGLVTNIILNMYGNLLTIELYKSPKKVYQPFTNLPDLAKKLINHKCHLMATEYVMSMYPMLFPIFTNYHTVVPELAQIAKDFRLAEELNPPTVVPLKGTLKDYAEVLRDRRKIHPDCFIMVTYSDEAYYFKSQLSSEFSIQSEASITTAPYAYYYSGQSRIIKERIRTVMSSDSTNALHEWILLDFYQKQEAHSEAFRSSNASNDQEFLKNFLDEVEVPKSSEGRPLSLQQTFDAFCLFLCGNVLAIVVIVTESLLWCRYRR